MVILLKFLNSNPVSCKAKQPHEAVLDPAALPEAEWRGQGLLAVGTRTPRHFGHDRGPPDHINLEAMGLVWIRVDRIYGRWYIVHGIQR